MSTDVLERTEVETETFKATAHDRCMAGGCGAQALVLAMLGDTDLLFCVHHSRKHDLALIAAGFRILRDEEGIEALAGAPSISATGADADEQDDED
jgi:ABC-type tungstate transport system permease subunit